MHTLKDYLMFKGISEREAEVVSLVAKGLTNKEIGNQLFIKEKTVKFHLSNVYKRMSVKNRTQLVVEYFKLNEVKNV